VRSKKESSEESPEDAERVMTLSLVVAHDDMVR
jgi:hypothetical protein